MHDVDTRCRAVRGYVQESPDYHLGDGVLRRLPQRGGATVMRLMRRSRGQSSVEQALLVVLSAAALAGVFGYIRSSAAYNMKSGADGVGSGMLY